MNFLKKWLNWKAMGLLSILVLLGVGAGWVWHRSVMVERNFQLQTAVWKYGGFVQSHSSGYRIQQALVDSKIATQPSSFPGNGIFISGRKFDIARFLANPIAVEISGSPAIDDDDLKRVASFGSIRILELPVSTLGDPQAEILGRCRNLEYLNLTGVSLSNNGFVHLGSLSRLKGFTFSNSVLSDQSCEILLKMKHLTHLEIRRTSFTIEGLALLVKEHRSLSEIFISEGVLENSEIKQMKELNSNLKITMVPVDNPSKALDADAVFGPDFIF